MRMTIELTIEADESDPVEIAVAIRNATKVLEMPNGDTLYLDDVSVVIKDVSE